MDRLFRKAKFGGFNKEDVMQYIETMKTEFFEYKAQVEETIRELHEKLQAFEHTDTSAAPSAVEFLSSDSDPAVSINEATNHLKQVADELCEKMNQLIDHLPQQNGVPTVKAQEKPSEPETPDDKVDALLQQLFTQPNTPKTRQVQPSRGAFSLEDVLPAYLK